MKSHNHLVTDIPGLCAFLAAPAILADTAAASAVLVQVYSAQIDQDWIGDVTQAIVRALPTAVVVGATSCGEVVAGRTLTGATVVSITCFVTASLHAIAMACTGGQERQVGQEIGQAIRAGDKNVVGVLLLATPISIDSNQLLIGLEDAGGDFPVFGGGAANYFDISAPGGVFLGTRFLDQSAIAVVFSGPDLHIESRTYLGWQALSKEMTVTEVDGMLVKTVDNAPAFDIYRRYLDIPADDHLFTNALSFPFLLKRNGEILSRVPVAVDAQGAIQFVADIEVGEKFQIGYGDPTKIATDATAIHQVMQDFGPQAIFLYTCGCRRFLMQDDAGLETLPFENIAPTIGFYTAAEYFGRGGALNIFNTTMVAVGMREGSKRAGSGTLPALVEAGKQDAEVADMYVSDHTRVVSRLVYFIVAVTTELEAARNAAEGKSRQVGNLLDNSGQGFLSLAANLRVDPEYSHECERIFAGNTGGIANAFLPALLYPDATEQRAYLEKNLQRVFACSDKAQRRDTYLGLLPTEYQLHGRHYEAQYRFLSESIMLILTDVSDEISLQERVAQERQRIDFLVNAMENRNDLLDTLDAWRQFLSGVLPALLGSAVQAGAVLAEVYREIHTYKGLFAQEGLPSMPLALHRLEDRLAALIAAGAPTLDGLRQALAESDLAAPLEADLALLREKLGSNYFAAGKLMNLPAAAIEEIESAALTAVDTRSDQGRRLLTMIHRLHDQPLAGLLEPHFKAATQLAQRVGKDIAPIRYEGDDIAVDPRLVAPFCKALVHVFRNCVDHGIEDAEARLNAGKDEIGHIYCRVQRRDGALLLCIGDDGVGIDVERLRVKAVEKGVVSSDGMATMNDQAALRLIFSDGISSRDAVNDISGRGIGLAATLHETGKLGGTVDVVSVPGSGTEFRFSLPIFERRKRPSFGLPVTR